MIQNEMKFQRIGGSYQLMINTAEDLKHILELSDEHWAVTSLQASSLVCDKTFLSILDSDSNGRIRSDEVRALLKRMLSIFRDYDGILSGSDILRIDSLNQDDADGKLFYDTCKLALSNIGCSDSPVINASQLSDHEKLVSNALQNGDGVIPPEALTDQPDLADCVRLIMTLVGKKADFSGVDGVSREETDKFEALLTGWLAWMDEGKTKSAELYPYPENKTSALWTAFFSIKGKVDDYFKSCCTALFAGDLALSGNNTFDQLDSGSIDPFLEKSPIAAISKECILELNQRVNPLWRSKLELFFKTWNDAESFSCNQISMKEWNELSLKLAPYGAWLEKKNTSLFDGMDIEKLRKYVTDDSFNRLRNYMTIDESVLKNIQSCERVCKLILCQKYILEFLRNYVSMDSIFQPEANSMLLAGRLIMDGRQFRLCTLVSDVAEHKRIAAESDICIMYLDITTGTGAAAKKQKLAVAVTSGNMRNLFVGKNGIFITADGIVWDAKVCDFIQQPVSVSEAIRQPFLKFGEFLQKQADKYFSTRSKSYEDAVAKDIQSKTAPVPAKPQQTPAVSGSLMLMGGGVGIAAIGSSFAFMAKSLQGISVGTVLGVFFGILLIFGGPIITVSLVKLFRRSISRFLEANSFALNRSMRMSIRLGKVFTFTPKLPKNKMICGEKLLFLPVSEESGRAGFRTWFLRLLLFLLVLAACWCLGAYLYRICCGVWDHVTSYFFGLFKGICK